MEFKDNKNISAIHDDPAEGKVFDFPQCINCEHNKDGFCEMFQRNRLELVANKITDIFNCPKFKSKW